MDKIYIVMGLFQIPWSKADMPMKFQDHIDRRVHELRQREREFYRNKRKKSKKN